MLGAENAAQVLALIAQVGEEEEQIVMLLVAEIARRDEQVQEYHETIEYLRRQLFGQKRERYVDPNQG